MTMLLFLCATLCFLLTTITRDEEKRITIWAAGGALMVAGLVHWILW